MTLPLFAAAACGFLALGRVPAPAQSPVIILRASSDHALRVTLPPRSAIPRPWRRVAADQPDGKRRMMPTESALAVFLSYSTISAGWYLIGMAIALAGPMSSIPLPGAASGVRLAAARLAGAWAMTFAASQVTTPWRGAGAGTPHGVKIHRAASPAYCRADPRSNSLCEQSPSLLPSAACLAPHGGPYA